MARMFVVAGALVVALGAAAGAAHFAADPAGQVWMQQLAFLGRQEVLLASAAGVAFGLVLIIIGALQRKPSRDAGARVGRGHKDAPDVVAAPPKPSPASAPDDALSATRIRDLTFVADALEKRRAAVGSYPLSKGWQGYASAYGAQLGTAWIPELVPAYAERLPRDPASADEGEIQYLYFSDGRNYKLIAHCAGAVPDSAAKAGVNADPVRAHYCYGIWSGGGADF